MPSAANLRFQDYQFQQATLQGYWKWTTRMDVTGPAPMFSIRDIVSPYGLLRDSIPIPGVVIQSMAESIGNLQASFTPSILLNPVMLTFTVDEGRGFGTPQCVSVTNTGVFGSLLDASITSDAPFVRVNPEAIGNLASTETGVVEVVVDASGLLAANSPYLQTITVQDPRANNSPVSLPITIVVKPKSVIGTSLTALTFFAVKPLIGAFPPVPAQSFMLTNTGDPASMLSYTIQKLYGGSSWLTTYSPMTGDLAGGSGQPITVAVAPPAACLPGTYTEVLRISGYSSNNYKDVQVTLVIT